MTVRLWDLKTGNEVFTLRGHSDRISNVALSPDGLRIATTSSDSTVKIWDATPTAVIQPLYDARHLVQSLYDRLLLREDVLSALRGDKTISDRLRTDALALAARILENPGRLNSASWAVARRPNATAADYRRSLRLAEVAWRLSPRDFHLLDTLGVAQYRLGQYADSIATLERSIAANRGHDAFDLFFLAMAHAHLEHRDQARDCFARAVKWVSEQKRLSRQWAAELAAFRAEAEGVLVRTLGELPADVFAVPISAP
jgi:tetratricopeptide (TPR) repeat protein